MRKNEMRRWERSERWESIFRAGCGRKPLSVQLIFLVTIDLHSTWPRGNPQRRPAPAPHAGGHRNRLEGLAASGKKQDDVLGAMGIDFFDLVVVGCGLVCRRRLGSTFSSLAGPSGEARGARPLEEPTERRAHVGGDWNRPFWTWPWAAGSCVRVWRGACGALARRRNPLKGRTVQYF